MKHIIVCLGVILTLFGHGHAQLSPEQSRKSEAILMKLRQIDLLTQFVPLALSKEQINKLLPAVERARAKVIALQKEEAQTLEKLDGKITEAISKSIDKNTPPPKALLDELALATATMGAKRDVLIDENTVAVMKVFNDICNAGQKKAAANSLAPQLFDPNLKPDKMTDGEKIRFFVQQIVLDPQSYDVLIRLEKHAP
jgi:hypothetical protein